MLTTLTIELKAAFNISGEQPGFTTIFTCHTNMQKEFTLYHDMKCTSKGRCQNFKSAKMAKKKSKRRSCAVLKLNAFLNQAKKKTESECCQIYFVKISLQFLYPSHVVLVLYSEAYGLALRTRSLKLKGSWISV